MRSSTKKQRSALKRFEVGARVKRIVLRGARVEARLLKVRVLKRIVLRGVRVETRLLKVRVLKRRKQKSAQRKTNAVRQSTKNKGVR